MSNEIEQITEVLRRYESCVNAGDHDGLGKLYHEDAILFPDRFDTFQGVGNITGFYQFAFSMLKLELTFNIDPQNIVIENDLAYATTDSTGTRFIKETGDSVPEINRELWVFSKIDNEWMIARYCFNKSE